MIDQRRIPADGRDREPLRPHAGRPLEFARRRQHARLLDHRLQRSRDAGRLALKARWREQNGRRGKPAGRPNLVTGPVQVCWHKFCGYSDVELREVPMEPGAVSSAQPKKCVEAVRRQYDRRRRHARHRRSPVNTSRFRQTSAALDRLQARQGGSTSPRTSTAPAAALSRRFSSPSWSGISACRESNRSTPRATSSALRRWESAG